MSTTYIILIVAIVLIAWSIKIVPHQQVLIIERLGRYNRTLTSGLNFIIPIIEQVRMKHDLRVQQVNVPPQTVITKDNVQVAIDTAIFFQVTHAEQATYQIEDLLSGIVNITSATMRQSIGKIELDETLSGRERISAELRHALDEATTPWGVRIERVEVLDIKPPKDIQEAMDKQMKAERTKRAVILEAEASKQDKILRAEGERQSKILLAEADKEARIREAEGLKKAQELEAEGQASAIKSVAEAEKARIQALNEAGLDDKVLTYKSYEALIEMSKGEANKVFIPTNAVETLGSIGAVAEMFKNKS